MKIDTAPDITLLGQPSPYAERGRTLTVGQLAALVREVAARPQDWWHLVRFDGRVRMPVPGVNGRGELWLNVLPPAPSAGPAGIPAETEGTAHAVEVVAVIAGEVSCLTVTEGGVAERRLRPGPVTVLARPRPGRTTPEMRVLASAGPSYAIALHATATRQG